VKIFVVEDDKWYADVLAYSLKLNPDYEVNVFTSGKDLLHNMHLQPDVITLDYRLPDISGEVIMKEIRQKYPHIPIVVVSGQDDIGIAIELLKAGAYDYIVKNEETKGRIWAVMKNIDEHLRLVRENDELRSSLGQENRFSSKIKGNSPALKKVFGLMEKASKSDITVSIYGETGTGKELVARAIHHNSARKNKPFVAVNVGAIPSELIESELFGHEKGSFTGAHQRRIGKFEEAQHGTLFLDEIGEMDLNMQVKILRCLQEKEIVRVGGNKPIKIDIRVITATNRQLSQEVKAGNFRKDLYYRLMGLPIELPPLKERGNDILILAQYFINRFAREQGLDKKALETSARNKLMSYPYPGNVRELKAVVERAVVMSEDLKIVADDIVFDEFDVMDDLMSEEMSLDLYIVKIIKFFLEKYNNSPTVVARKLNISKSTIYRMKNKYKF
jgi:DNA-binding NtrC family response regulator